MPSRCGHQLCKKQGKYGVEGTKKWEEYCPSHANKGTVNVRRKRCGHPGCNKWPTYGVEGTKKAELCLQNARVGMMDVVSRTSKSMINLSHYLSPPYI